jgi:hypothetical protein
MAETLATAFEPLRVRRPVTRDVDICCRFSKANLMRIHRALANLHPIHFQPSTIHSVPRRIPLRRFHHAYDRMPALGARASQDHVTILLFAAELDHLHRTSASHAKHVPQDSLSRPLWNRRPPHRRHWRKFSIGHAAHTTGSRAIRRATNGTSAPHAPICFITGF